MTFVRGDRVHLVGLGSGIIRETRGSGRYAVEIKGRLVIAAARDLEPADSSTKSRMPRATAPVAPAAPGRTQPHQAIPGAPGIDLHGKTVDEAIAAVEVFVNDALLAGHGEARVIHGRSGGRLKVALHRYLRGLPGVASFRVDPGNPGVTIIVFEG